MFKRILLFLSFLLAFLNLNAQVESFFGGTINVYSSSGSGPEYTLQGFFNDVSGEYASDSVALGDIIYVSEGSTCVRLRIDTINSSSGGIVDVDVFDVDTILVSPPSGISALMRETPNAELPRYIPGLSETLLSCIRTHMTGKVDENLDGSGGNTTFMDSLPVASIIIDANGNLLKIDSTSTIQFNAVGTAQGDLIVSGNSSLPSSLSHISGGDTSQINIRAATGITFESTKDLNLNLGNINSNEDLLTIQWRYSNPIEFTDSVGLEYAFDNDVPFYGMQLNPYFWAGLGFFQKNADASKIGEITLFDNYAPRLETHDDSLNTYVYVNSPYVELTSRNTTTPTFRQFFVRPEGYRFTGTNPAYSYYMPLESPSAGDVLGDSDGDGNLEFIASSGLGTWLKPELEAGNNILITPLNGTEILQIGLNETEGLGITGINHTYDGTWPFDNENLNGIFYNGPKWAFRAGYASGEWDDANTGDGSVAFGENSVASGNYSFATGYHNIATDEGAIAMGYESNATGLHSVASGNGNEASGDYSFAIGDGCVASGNYSFATGDGSFATGELSVAIGTAVATAERAVAIMGRADSLYSTAIGGNTKALHDYSTAIGWGAQTSEAYEVSLGDTFSLSKIKLFETYNLAHALPGTNQVMYWPTPTTPAFGTLSTLNPTLFNSATGTIPDGAITTAPTGGEEWTIEGGSGIINIGNASGAQIILDNDDDELTMNTDQLTINVVSASASAHLQCYDLKLGDHGNDNNGTKILLDDGDQEVSIQAANGVFFAGGYSYVFPTETPASADSLKRVMLWEQGASTFEVHNGSNYRTATATGNILPNDDYVEVDPSVTVYLPPPSVGYRGKEYTIIAGGGTGGGTPGTIAVRDGSSTIETGSSLTLTIPWGSYTVVCNGSQWIVISSS